jgi:hypothetical protein
VEILADLREAVEAFESSLSKETIEVVKSLFKLRLLLIGNRPGRLSMDEISSLSCSRSWIITKSTVPRSFNEPMVGLLKRASGPYLEFWIRFSRKIFSILDKERQECETMVSAKSEADENNSIQS